MKYPTLPAVLETAISECREQSQPLVRNSLNHLWFDACKRKEDGSVFVQTGDIPAMWIRDSTWQVLPLTRFAKDPEIYELISGVIKSQVKFLSIDPYANAFNEEPNGNCWHKDFPDQSPWVFERKWELDSISGFLQLSLEFLAQSGSDAHLDDEWLALFDRLLGLLEREQKHDPLSYRFVRDDAPAHDYLSHDGYGAPFKKCGLVWDAFRPSDDACEMPFHVPSNLHIFKILSALRDLDVFPRRLTRRATRIAKRIIGGLSKHTIVDNNGQLLFAYEVDGLGGRVLMDDANHPNLLTQLPLLSLMNKEIANNTVDFIFSDQNPWYFKGSAASGVGSPHTGKNMVWPLSIASKGLILGSIVESLDLIESTVTPDLNIHESFDVNNPSKFTREWFSWAEMTYVELAFSMRDASIDE